MKKIFLIIVTTVLIFSMSACDALLDDSSGSGSALDEFTLEEAVQAIKDGLIWCAEQTIVQLDPESESTTRSEEAKGFLENEIVKILFPEDAQEIIDTVIEQESNIKTAAGLVGIEYDLDMAMDDVESNIIIAMNRAAEAAVRDDETIAAFTSAISDLSLDDAFDILKGVVPGSREGEAEEPSPYAATSYLKSVTYDALYEVFYPIINGVLSDDSVTGLGYSVNELWTYFLEGVDAYQYIDTNYDIGLLAEVKDPPTDLPAYVTEKALKGLFYYIGVFEIEMRDTFEELFAGIDLLIEAFEWAKENFEDFENVVENIGNPLDLLD